MNPETDKPKPQDETIMEQVLTDKPPSLHPQDSVHKAGERMREMHTSEWPVAEEKKLLGMVDQPHPDRAVARYGHDPKATTVRQNMSREVAFCYEDQTCAEALAAMEARHLRYLPVVDRNQRITGIVSREELLAKCSGDAKAKSDPAKAAGA
jgi:CBS domain-containing protein